MRSWRQDRGVGSEWTSKSTDHRGVNTQAAGEPQFPQLQPEMLPLTVSCQKGILWARMQFFPSCGCWLWRADYSGEEQQDRSGTKTNSGHDIQKLRGLRTGKILGAFGITQNANVVLRSKRMFGWEKKGARNKNDCSWGTCNAGVHVLRLHWTKQGDPPPIPLRSHYFYETAFQKKNIVGSILGWLGICCCCSLGNGNNGKSDV